jgi:hypothetical protein
MVSLDGINEVARTKLTGGRSLRWRIEDSPYDEALHVYLLDSSGSVVDAIEASAPMTPGILHILASDHRQADFRFFKNDLVYRLSLRDEAAISFSLALPPGFRYKRTFKPHWLMVGILREEPG